MCFHLHAVSTPVSSEAMVEGDGHGNWIGKRDTAFSGLLLVSLARATVTLDGKASQFVVESLNAGNITLIQNSCSAGGLPPDEFHRKIAEHHDPRCLGIYPHVVFGGRRHVSFATRSASHNHAATDFGGDRGPLFQGKSNIGERTQSDNHKSGISFDRLDQRIDSM